MVSPPLNPPLERLPLVTLYLTERCNSRCVTCDYWRRPGTDVDIELVARLLPELASFETQVALISGGEPLLHAQWAAICELLVANGLRLWLLTSGLALAKHAARVAELFDQVTVSVDGTDRATYVATRGLDAFDKVCEGVRAVAARGMTVSIRVTLQRSNFRQLARFVELARECGAHQVSFLAVDVANPHAFGRTGDFESDLALRPEDLCAFEHEIDALEQAHADDFRSGFIAESPEKIRRLLRYFQAVAGQGAFPPVRCNAPEFSAVINANGRVSPCYFIGGPVDSLHEEPLPNVLNGTEMRRLRHEIRVGNRPECTRCVCSLWRETGQRRVSDFLRRNDA